MSRASITAGKAVIVVELSDKATLGFSKLVGGLSASMMKASRSFRDAATNAFGGALLSGMATNNVMKKFAEFDDLIKNLTVKLGYFGQKTQEQVKNIADLEAQIKHLGSTTSYTSAQVAEAAVALAQAGFKVDEIKTSLQGVMDLARGTGYSLGASADLIANLIRNFNMFGEGDSLEQRIKTVNELSSQLVKATRLGTIEIADLMESFKYAGGTASGLGIEVHELLGMFVQMSEAGLKGSLAGTSLNTMMLNMIKNMDKLKEVFPAFNVMLKENGRIDLGSTVEQIVKLSSTLNEIDRVAFFQDIFNIRGARAQQAIFEIGRVKEFTKAIRAAAAEARLAAIEMESGFGGASRRAYNAFDNLRLTIGKAVSGEFTALFNMLAGVSRELEKMVPRNKNLILGFMSLPVILGAAGVAALTMSFALARLSRVLGVLQIALRGVKSVGGMMVSNILTANSRLPGRGPSRRAQIAAQAAKVAASQKQVDGMMARAAASKDPIKAMTKVSQTKAMQRLISRTTALQQLRQGTFSARAASAGRGVAAMGQAVSARRQVNAEIGFYKKKVAAYTAYTGKMRQKYQFHQTMAAKYGAAGNTASAAYHGQQAGRFGAAAKRGAALRGSSMGLLNAARGVKSGMNMAALAKIAAAGPKLASGLLSLTTGFLRLSMGITKFVFSWNFVGLVFNGLLMFGHKIPVIAQAFKDLGAGFMAAFGELGKIATYAAPAMDLLSLAFNAFSQGSSDIGFSALSAAFTGIVDIIKNQLIAAWNMFMYHVEYVVVFFQQIYKSVEIIVRSLFEGVTQALGVMGGPVMQALGTIGTAMSGGGSMASVATSVVQGIDYFITYFFKGIIMLNDYLMKFLYNFQDVMGQIIEFGLGKAGPGQSIRRQAAINQDTYELTSSVAKGRLEAERRVRAKEIAAIMNRNFGEMAQGRAMAASDANNASAWAGFDMAKQFTDLSRLLQEEMNVRQQEIAALQQEAAAANAAQSVPRGGGAQASIIESVKAVTGYLNQTRETLKSNKDSKEIEKEQLDVLKDINRNVATQGIG